MTNYLVVFSSRNDTMNFYKMIKQYGYYASTVNTPSSIASSCGISTKIDSILISTAKNIIIKYHFTTFKGIYHITIQNGREHISRIW